MGKMIELTEELIQLMDKHEGREFRYGGYTFRGCDPGYYAVDDENRFVQEFDMWEIQLAKKHIATDWNVRGMTMEEVDRLRQDVVYLMLMADDTRKTAYADVLKLLRGVSEAKRGKPVYTYKVFDKAGKVLLDSTQGTFSPQTGKLYRVNHSKDRARYSALFAVRVLGDRAKDGRREIYRDGELIQTLRSDYRSLRVDSYDAEDVKRTREFMGLA